MNQRTKNIFLGVLFLAAISICVFEIIVGV